MGRVLFWICAAIVGMFMYCVTHKEKIEEYKEIATNKIKERTEDIKDVMDAINNRMKTKNE